MKDEIKEIKVIKSNHSYMIEYKNGGKFTQYGVEEDLLDYINNLQTIEQQYSAILSENAELENKITNLQKENKQLKKDFISQNNTIIDLHIELNQRQHRINKAINKLNNLIDIENKESSYDRYFGDNTYLINELKNIKNILESDNNND